MDTESLRLSKDELSELYPDATWRTKIFETSHLVAFLSNCILGENYKVPDELPGLVPLTSHGSDVMNKLIRRHEVPAKIARLLCLLRLVHREPLVDFDEFDVELLRRFIDRQIRDSEIRFPFVLGRDLYDRASSLFEEPRATLTYAESLELLDELPAGVFQAGPFVSGPFGLLRSQEHRWFGPVTQVPMFHCAELTCKSIHRSRLQTDIASPINEHRLKMKTVLDTFGEDDSEWGEFIRSVNESEGVEFDDKSGEPTVLALGDLFGTDELRRVLAEVLDTTQGSLRSLVEPLGLVGRASDIADDLDRAQTIQLLLLASNEALIARIDSLVNPSSSATEENRVNVAPGEVRRLMTNRSAEFGVYGTFPELSQAGLRFKSNSFTLGPMRLKRLVEGLYDLENPDELKELEWQLRSVEGDEPKERLEELARKESPRAVVEQLVLARRSNKDRAAGDLGLEYDAFSGDDTFVRSVLWKLGFYPDGHDDPTRDFWEQFERLRKFVDTAGVGARVDSVDLRSRAMNCFVALEGVLDASLSFSTWALTKNHLEGTSPFAFAPWLERSASFDQLNEFERARRTARGEEAAQLGEENTLGPLIQGFSILRALLVSYQDNSSSHLRDRESYPNFAAHTDLKKFPFEHTVPFLDLLPKSKSRILDSLESVAHTLSAAETASVRNDFGHFRASPPDLSRVDAALTAMESSVRRLEADGLVNMPYSAGGASTDSWGRRVVTLKSTTGREVAFARPTAYDWAQMPSLRGVQFVMPSAIFARPNEMLRFRPVYRTSYAEYWENYPQRRRRQGAISGNADSADPGGI